MKQLIYISFIVWFIVSCNKLGTSKQEKEYVDTAFQLLKDYNFDAFNNNFSYELNTIKGNYLIDIDEATVHVLFFVSNEAFDTISICVNMPLKESGILRNNYREKSEILWSHRDFWVYSEFLNQISFTNRLKYVSIPKIIKQKLIEFYPKRKMLAIIKESGSQSNLNSDFKLLIDDNTRLDSVKNDVVFQSLNKSYLFFYTLDDTSWLIHFFQPISYFNDKSKVVELYYAKIEVYDSVLLITPLTGKEYSKLESIVYYNMSK